MFCQPLRNSFPLVGLTIHANDRVLEYLIGDRTHQMLLHVFGSQRMGERRGGWDALITSSSSDGGSAVVVASDTGVLTCCTGIS